MRPTPETDALILSKGGFGMTNYEWREHSRKLERERDEAREIIKIVAQDKDKIIEQLIVERDSNRKAFETLRGLYSNEITKNINI